MNDLLRRKMSRAINRMRHVGFDMTGFVSRRCEFVTKFPWIAEECHYTAWEPMCPIILSPDRQGMAFKQGKGWVVIYKRAER